MIERVYDMIEDLKSLPSINGPRFSWDWRRGELRKRLIEDDPLDFISWSIVHECLFTGKTWDAEEELKIIYESDILSRYGQFDFLDGTTIHQIYSIHMYETYTGRSIDSLDSILEFGGGYGSMCRVCRRLGFNGTYSIFDFPELSILQHIYLDEYEFTSMNRLEDLSDRADLAIGICSISETPIRDRILFLDREIDSLLIRYQIEWGENESWGTINNSDFFNAWARERGYQTTDIPAHYPDHRYLIGRKFNG